MKAHHRLGSRLSCCAVPHGGDLVPAAKSGTLSTVVRFASRKCDCESHTSAGRLHANVDDQLALLAHLASLSCGRAGEHTCLSKHAQTSRTCVCAARARGQSARTLRAAT